MKMKTINFFGTLLTGLILITACNKPDDAKLSHSDYLVFGHFIGECVGERCIEIFKLENDKLYEDRNDNYPWYKDFYKGNYDLLSSEKFEKVKDLIDFFPDSLLLENATLIGQPDVTDGGGLYVEYNFNGINKFWLIDQIKTNVPDYLHPFIDKVNEKIELINQ